MNNYTCKVCGKEYDTITFSSSYCSRECFAAQYWNKYLDDSALIINGICYHAATEEPKRIYKSFAGFSKVYKYEIHTTDGRIIKTNKLYVNGYVPEGIADNAAIVKGGNK